MTRDDRVELAARNNARWCHTMCLAHGTSGSFAPDAWTSARRTPPLYPDAVTLTRGASAADLLARTDTAAPGASVKDSFAALDLGPAGFEVLFEARWLHRPADGPARPAPAGSRWERVATARELAVWADAWDGGEGLAGLFRPELLRDADTAVLTARGPSGAPVAGAVVTADGTAAGVSNLFTADGADPDAAWAGCLAAVSRMWPGVPVVGYEHGDDLAAATRHGLVPVGPLRVWLATAAPAADGGR
ncbi:hypothetical protein [Streptomyces genisteinicus]|uniref:Uncharacterized protein n=1 Tax=Streptomyces genisteinicus TaxID=2768068 RepID=A0A7H0HRM7_9ACTN|nr:hypothetical protein [Streptomyces genisteinicus]QNP63193.1 hypothetical protein IAG43_09765 [Streptomyces genisteinicus]